MDNQQPSIKEIWKTCTEYDRYEVSNLGNVRHKQRLRNLKSLPYTNGYTGVTFNINGHRIRFLVHRLVAKAFIPNPNNLPEVNHKDGNRTNNKIGNLEWCDSSYNKIHAYQKKENRYARGKIVCQYDLNGNLLNTYPSISEAARQLQCGVSSISNCCLGRTKTCKGYKWDFDEGSTTKYKRNPSLSVQDSFYEQKDEDIV